MTLFLVELEVEAGARETVATALDGMARLLARSGGELLEATVARGGRRAFAVALAGDPATVSAAAQESAGSFTGPDPVRLVGATLDEVRAARGEAGYLVEWDFPEDLTMDAYLERKKQASPKYADVPEVSFLRTYVREDMSKCLCLYDAGCEDDVVRARDVVGAPVSRLHQLDASRSGNGG